MFSHSGASARSVESPLSSPACLLRVPVQAGHGYSSAFEHVRPGLELSSLSLSLPCGGVLVPLLVARNVAHLI